MPIDHDALGQIHWDDLNHAHGPAGVLPDLLRALWHPDWMMRDAAYESLDEELHHQYSRYEASGPAVPFIIDVVADTDAPDRHRACLLLSGLAVGDESQWLIDWPNVDELRNTVARKQHMTVEELEQELAEWVAAAPNEADRILRSTRAEYDDVDITRDGERWDLAVYEAVRAGVPAYINALESVDHTLRQCAAYLLGWFTEERSTIAPALARLITAEPNVGVAATAVTAAGLVGGDDPALTAALAPRLDSPHPALRWPAAIALTRVCRSPEPRVVRELYDCLRNGHGIAPPEYYDCGDMSGLAMLALPFLTDEAAPDRLDVLIERISQPPEPVNLKTIIAFSESLSKIFFPEGPQPDDVPFDALSAEQRKLVVARHEAEKSGRRFWWLPPKWLGLRSHFDLRAAD